MRIAVIGPLEVLTEHDVPVVLPDATDRLLLAVLTAAAPDVVSTDRLIEALWHGEPPEPAREFLQVHLARLRRALEPGQPPGASGQYVLRRGAGYVLTTCRADIDALHIGDLSARGRTQLAAGDAAEAVRLLTAALALWRGEPYAEWPDAFFAGERRRLAGVRADVEGALTAARADVAAHPERTETPRRLPAVAVARDEQAHVRPDDEGSGSLVLRAREVRPADGSDHPADQGTGGRRAGLAVGGLLAALVAALAAAWLTARSEEETERAATVADAERLAALSTTADPLDLSFLLAAQAFRLADTSVTRDGLLAVLHEHERVERAVSFSGSPRDAALSGNGRTLSFGVSDAVVAWSLGPSTRPRVLMGVPGEWGAWMVAAPSPVEDAVMGAGLGDRGPWLRMVSARDGTSRLLLEGDQVGGRPVDGAVSADGRRLLLVVAEPEVPDDASRWQLIDVDAADGTRRDTGIAGVIRVPIQGVRADFADDARSFVVWNDTGPPAATLVDVASARQTAVPAQQRAMTNAGFRALSSGAAQLWDDGQVTLVDRGGVPVQELDAHGASVQDVVVSPDGTWAVTAGGRGEAFRWTVDPSTGRWSEPELLDGHAGQVVGVEVDTDGGRLVTVSLDHTAISWDPSPAGGERADRPADPAVWLEEACAVVGRDLTAGQWRRYLPDRPWQPTCTDLG
jgi:hypothetical protein